jgi:hypothetical protein
MVKDEEEDEEEFEEFEEENEEDEDEIPVPTPSREQKIKGKQIVPVKKIAPTSNEDMQRTIKKQVREEPREVPKQQIISVPRVVTSEAMLNELYDSSQRIEQALAYLIEALKGGQR